MRKVVIGGVGLVMLGGMVMVGVASVPAQQEGSAVIGQNYLYIEELEIAPGTVPNEAIAQLSDWVRARRATGER